MTYSVVIPTYNAGRFLGEAIESVLAQTVRPLEIIVIDDGSTDDTARRMERYAGVVKYIRKQNEGVSATRNRGVAEAKGEFVAFLDADDCWLPRKMELQLRAFEKNPGLVILGTSLFDWPTPNMPRIPADAAGGITSFTWRELVVRNRLMNSSVVARTECLRRAGPFDTQLQGPEDHDMWLRVARLGEMANIEMPLVGYRCVAGSVSKQAFRCRDGMLRLLKKIDQAEGLGGWGADRSSRRRAFAHVHHSVACVFSAANMPGHALLSSIKSLLWHPFMMLPGEVESSLARPRRLAVNILRVLRLKGPDGSPPPTSRVESAPVAQAGGA